MVFYGAHIKKQMLIADGPSSPKKAQASKYIEGLVKKQDGDFGRVFRLTHLLLILGLLLAILGGVILMAELHRSNIN